MLKKIFTICAVSAVVLIAKANAQVLNVVSWEGPYSRAQTIAYSEPWREKTGKSYKLHIHDGTLDELRAQVESGNISWDIVDVEMSNAVQACNDGIIEKIDPRILPDGSDGVAAHDDFIEGAIHECGVANSVWSMVIFFDEANYEIAPTRMADFFDVKSFPGPRGMRRHARANLEMALIADGVPARDVYDVLMTPEGVDRAFKKLELIKDHIVWWANGDELLELADKRRVAMSTGFHDSLVSAIATENKPYKIIWDGQVWDMEAWVILKGAKNKDAAIDYLRFSTETEQQVAQARLTGLGATRKSATKLDSVHLQNPSLRLVDYSPTNPKNLKNGVRNNTAFWSEFNQVLMERFDAWAGDIGLTAEE